MLLSASFAPSTATPGHVALAEDLGYARAWVYDSPALYADPWMILALAAARTSRIGLGPGVLVPSLRHVVVTASAVLTLEELAPGRAAIAVGTGFTGRLPLGQPGPLPWREVRDYLVALRALLAGEDAAWDGATLGLLHGSRFAPPRPVAVPIVVAADGPKGRGIAGEVGDGVFATRGGVTGGGAVDPGTSVFEFAMVLDEGQGLDDEHVLATMGWAPALAYHGAHASGAVTHLPEGDRWLAAVEEVPEHRRHLAVHEGHMVAPNPRDAVVSAASMRSLLPHAATVGNRATVREHLAGLADRGVGEVTVHMPANAVEDQLEKLARAAEGVVELVRPR